MKIPYAYLADWYTTKYFNNIIWSKFDIARAKELHLKYIPTTDNKPQKGYSMRPKSHQVTIELSLDRHTQVKPNNKRIWFYPAILEDIYDQTNNLFFKDELSLPPIRNTAKYQPWNDLTKLKEILTTPNLDNPAHRFILNLAFDQDGTPFPHTLELIPGLSNTVPPILEIDSTAHLPKPLTEAQRVRLNSGNPLLAALEILQEEKILVNTLSLVKRNSELDKGITYMI